jgi:hypothetical protein
MIIAAGIATEVNMSGIDLQGSISMYCYATYRS